MTAPMVIGPAGADLVDRLAASLGTGVERRETHCSWVLLTGDRAIKVKKPVMMDFLDYGTLERRRAMCREEVAVNRRAAPGLYLGVRAIVPAGPGLALAAEHAPDAIEYAVEMRRFDESATLAARLERSLVSPRTGVAVGTHLAEFHARCPIVHDASGAEAVKRSIDDDFATLLTLAHARRDLVEAERFADAFLASRWDELDRRARDGHVRDGHGDLRMEHVVLGRGIALVDAIEFDPGLRQIDVGMDLAFLVMELHAAGRADLAGALVAGYREAGGDAGDDALIACFAAYRAQVRAKVALLRAQQVPPGSPAAIEARAHAQRLLGLAERMAWTARRPVVIAVCGVAATGKSTLAAELALRSGLAHLSSDVVRKRSLGFEPTDRAPAAAYTPAMSDETYRELGRLAAAEGSAVVDATFHRRALRDAFRAELEGAPVLFVECSAPRVVLEDRIAARMRNPGRTSDADLGVLADQLRAADPFDELAPADHLAVRSDQPVDVLVAAVADAVDRRLSPA